MKQMLMALGLVLLASVTRANSIASQTETDEMLLAFDLLDTRGAVEASPYDQLRMLIEPIRPGTARAEVERVLPARDEGLQRSSLTRYYCGSGYAVVVPYDAQGGGWSGNNRVSGPVTLLRISR